MSDVFEFRREENTLRFMVYSDKIIRIIFHEETEGVDTFRRNVGYRMIGRKRE